MEWDFQCISMQKNLKVAEGRNQIPDVIKNFLVVGERFLVEGKKTQPDTFNGNYYTLKCQKSVCTRKELKPQGISKWSHLWGGGTILYVWVQNFFMGRIQKYILKKA